MAITSIEQIAYYDTLPTPLPGSSSEHRWLALVPIVGFVVNHIIQSELNQLLNQKNLSKEDRYRIYAAQDYYIISTLVQSMLSLGLFATAFNSISDIAIFPLVIEYNLSMASFLYYQISNIKQFNDWDYLIS